MGGGGGHLIIVSLQVPIFDSETSILSLFDWNIDLDLDLDLDLTWTWSLTIVTPVHPLLTYLIMNFETLSTVTC